MKIRMPFLVLLLSVLVMVHHTHAQNTIIYDCWITGGLTALVQSPFGFSTNPALPGLGIYYEQVQDGTSYWSGLVYTGVTGEYNAGITPSCVNVGKSIFFRKHSILKNYIFK